MTRLILAAMVLASASASSPAATKLNVNFGVGWDGYYRPMQWTPVEIGITSPRKSPFDGTVSVTARQDELTSMTVQNRFVLTPKRPSYLPLVMKFAFAANECQVRIRDEKGRSHWRGEYQLWGSSGSGGTLQAVGEEEMLIGLVGLRRFGLTQLSGQLHCRSSAGVGTIHVRQKLIRYLPWDWTGYASLDLLVMYDPDWSKINPYQSKAIVEWVSNGGKLLVVLGKHSLPSDGEISKILPCEVSGVRRTTIIPARKLAEWCDGSVTKGDVPCWGLKARPGARVFDRKDHGTGNDLFAVGFAGFGCVGVLAFDPSALRFTQPKWQAKFWMEHLTPLVGDGFGSAGQRGIQWGSSPQRHGSRPYYETGLESRGANAIMEHLLNIRELRPISIWWVIVILASLAILLGPVDYFVLKVLDRQPLTWITSAVCVALFTGGAYYGVEWLRAGAMQVRVVSVLDGIEGDDSAWMTTYSGIFASQSDDYRLDGLRARQWWSAITPSAENLSVHRQKSIGSRTVICTHRDGGLLPASVPINILSMQCLLTESPAPALPISATVEKHSDDTVSVHIVNRADQPINSGTVWFANGRVIRFSSVPAGESKDFRAIFSRSLPWRDVLYRGGGFGPSAASFADERDTAYLARGILQRTQGIYAYLQQGAAVVCAEYENVSVPFAVAGRKCEYDHVRLVRLVVFPKEGFRDD